CRQDAERSLGSTQRRMLSGQQVEFLLDSRLLLTPTSPRLYAPPLGLSCATALCIRTSLHHTARTLCLQTRRHRPVPRLFRSLPPCAPVDPEEATACAG